MKDILLDLSIYGTKLEQEKENLIFVLGKYTRDGYYFKGGGSDRSFF